MPAITPTWPVQADHRFILKMMSMSFKDVVPIADEFRRISRVFCKVGGSWERLFHGSPDDVELLKKVLKVAYKQGYLTKKGKWA